MTTNDGRLKKKLNVIMRSSGRDVETTSIKERGENDTGKTTMSEIITQWLKEIISLKEKQDT